MALKISPSVLSADFGNLASDVRRLTQGGADSIHLDVMDGRFVPNITFGPSVVRDIRDKSDIPLIGHLMIEQPELMISEFAEAGCDRIVVHVEATVHLHAAIQQIKSLGKEAGVALNPSTPLGTIEHVLTDIDELLIMTVNPGFGGQEFIYSMLGKISDARRMVDESGLEVEIGVDGGINPETCKLVVEAGADLIIAGSFVFTYPEGVEAAINLLRASRDRMPGTKAPG